jgi:hypothetical protein
MTSERAVSSSGAAAPSRLDPYTFALFRRLSASRGVRIFHPRGVAHRALFRSAPNGLDAAVLAEGFEHEALVRLSRGLGFRPPLPDVLGLAVRLPDVYGRGSHQDFLLASSGSGPLGRRMLRPTRRSPAELYSSLLPYDVAGRRVLVGARPIASGPTAVFELLVASSTGPWHPVGRLSFAERLDESVARALRFDPWHSGGNIVPAGLANRLRAPAYRGSRRGSAK